MLELRHPPRLVSCLGACVLVLAAAACGRISFNDRPAADSGAPRDSAPTDSGGRVDSSVLADSGPNDTGTTGIDSGTVDAGTPEPVVIDTGAFPFAITADDTNVYWWDYNDGSLHRVPLDGSPPAVILPGGVSAGGYGLAVSGESAYLCDRTTGEVQRAPLTGGPIEVLAPGPCFDLVVDATHLYWSNTDPADQAIRRLALPGGAPEDVGGAGVAGNLAMRGNELYWTAYTPGAIFTMPKAGGPHSQLATVAPGGPWGIVVDATHVYWADHHAGTGGVARVPVTGGPVEVLATDQEGPHSVALDGAVVYWTNDLGDTVMRLDPGGLPVAVASGQDRAKDLVVTAGAIYWTTRGGDVVRLTQ